MGAEFGIFLERQQMMKEAHREQIIEVSAVPPPYIPSPNQERDNDRRLAELRKHIAQLRGDLVEVSKIPETYSRQLARYGRIYSREL